MKRVTFCMKMPALVYAISGHLASSLFTFSNAVLTRTSKMQQFGLLVSESLVSTAALLSRMDAAISCDLDAEAKHVQLLRPSRTS